jgi:hypothetical protein
MTRDFCTLVKDKQNKSEKESLSAQEFVEARVMGFLQTQPARQSNAQHSDM